MLTYAVPVTILSAEDVQRGIEAIWHGFLDALAPQDSGRAAWYLHSTAVAHYAEVFEQLRGDLPQIAAGLGEEAVVQAGATTAEYVVTRTLDGVERAFLIYFLRSNDGIWRIAAM